ncbi:unnamed protein product [Prunus armeniaca]
MDREHNEFDIYHFGFSPLTNEYKVLQIISSEIGDFRFNAFTLGRDSSWRPLQVDPVGDGCHLFEISVVARSFGSVCVNGAIHWFDGMKKTIVVFDVREEIFRVVPLAEDFAQEFGDYNFKISSSWQADDHPSIFEVGGSSEWCHYPRGMQLLGIALASVRLPTSIRFSISSHPGNLEKGIIDGTLNVFTLGRDSLWRPLQGAFLLVEEMYSFSYVI